MAGDIRILHVDDDPQFTDITGRFLRREDARFTIETATTAAEGRARLAETDFDCIIADYALPDEDGIAFLEAVRDDYPDLPFILFTGMGSEDVASEAIATDVTEYMQKQGGTSQYAVLANRVQNAVERYRAVRQSERSHRAMETASEGFSFVEPDGTFAYVNPAFAELFGYEPDELVGEHWSILYHDAEAQRLEADILPAVYETGYWAGETVRLTKQGDRLVTDHRLARTGGDTIVCTATDLTDQRATAARNSTQFDLLIDAMDDYAFFTLDHEGYITRWNEGATRLKGYTAEEVLGEHVGIFFTDEDRQSGLPEQLIESAKAEGSVQDEGWRLRKDGSRFWAEATFSASYDEAGTIRGFGKVIQEHPDATA